MPALGILNRLWQQRRFLNGIRMTKQEAEEEHHQRQGDPHVRAPKQGRRRQFPRQKMKNVRQAGMVATNPTHFATALKHNLETMSAPGVPAKG